MSKLIAPVAAALTFAVVVALGLGVGPQCADAWMSLSIGVAGACSSHGGVARDPLPVVLLAAALPAAGVWLTLRAVANVNRS